LRDICCEDGGGCFIVKYVLEFIMPEDKDEHYTAINAWRYRGALEGLLNQHIRSQLKYCEITDEVREALEKVREFVLQELDGVEI
jgi:hypothetical protein